MNNKVFLLAGFLFLFFLFADRVEAQELFRKPNHIVYLDQAVEYDSNVVTNVDQASTGEDDIILESIALVDMSVIDKTVEHYDVHLSYMFLQLLHDEFSNLDFRYHEPSAKFWLLMSPEWSLQVTGGYVITQEDNKDLYLGLFGEIEAEHPLSNDAEITLSYKLSDEDYKPLIYVGRDALKHRFEAEWEKEYTEKIDVSVKGRTDYNDADDDGYSYIGLEGEVGLDLYEWPGKWDWYFSAELLYRNYDDIYPGELEEREDERFTVTGEATYPIYKDLVSLSASLEYLHNFSNLETFDYDEVIVGGHVIVIF